MNKTNSTPKLSVTEMVAIFILIVYGLFSTCSYAQTAGPRKISFQLDAGTSIGMFSFRNTENFSGMTCVSPKMGLNVQAIMNYKINEDISLQTGISLVQHGAVITFSDPNPNCTSTIFQKDKMMFTYLQLPVMLKAGKEKGVFGCFGLALSMPVKVTDEFERQDVKWTASSSKDIIQYKGVTSNAVKDQVPLRLAAILKVGYNFKNKVGVFAGFDIAMGTPNSSTNINNSFHQSYGPIFSFSDSGLSLGLSYKF